MKNGCDFHVYFSFDFTSQGLVKQLASLLEQKFKLRVCFVDESVTGDYIAKILSGLQKSQHFVCFLTKRYSEQIQVTNGQLGCAKVEFDYACHKLLSTDNISVVVMEASMRNPSEWKGLLGMFSGRARGLLENSTQLENAADFIVKRVRISPSQTLSFLLVIYSFLKSFQFSFPFPLFFHSLSKKYNNQISLLNADPSLDRNLSNTSIRKVSLVFIYISLATQK